MPALTRRAVFAQLAGLGCVNAPKESIPSDLPWEFAVGLNGFGSSETHHDKTYIYEEILEFGRDEGFEGIKLWRN